MKYKISEYARKERVTIRTVWRWIKEGKVEHTRTASGGVRIIEDEAQPLDPIVATYARVSSSENKDNLTRQQQRLLDFCSAKGWKVEKQISEIASGLNDARPKLEKLLLDPSIELIVVEHKDRLARFGLNYIEKLLLMQNRKIIYINQSMDQKEDLMEDFVSIITSFCARLYGQRRTKRKTEQLIKQLQE